MRPPVQLVRPGYNMSNNWVGEVFIFNNIHGYFVMYVAQRDLVYARAQKLELELNVFFFFAGKRDATSTLRHLLLFNGTAYYIEICRHHRTPLAQIFYASDIFPLQINRYQRTSRYVFYIMLQPRATVIVRTIGASFDEKL